MNLIFQKDIYLIWILKNDIHLMNLRFLYSMLNLLSENIS